MGKYDDLVFCRGRTSQTRPEGARKTRSSYFPTQSITYKYCTLCEYKSMDNDLFLQ
jgi:hypothetical protein